MKSADTAGTAGNSPRRILVASLVGTSIEYFDFYIYATAAVLVFPKLFFPAGDAAAATLQSLGSFALAYLARPVGAILFGHFGDRIGRKATLVTALLTMGMSTIAIGVLPTHASIGLLAPLLLCLCRIGQGLGLGGEWGGAMLLSTENAPSTRRAWFGMFPQFGAPIGLVCSTGMFLLLSHWLTEKQFIAYGWRIPFLSSALLILVGLYVRLRLSETPDFERAIKNKERVRIPLFTVGARHPLALLLGTLLPLTVFTVFYLITVFMLSWATTDLGFTRDEFMLLQLAAMPFFALMIPVVALSADRYGANSVLIPVHLAVMGFGLLWGPLSGSTTTVGVLAFLAANMVLIGLMYGAMGTALAELFPTAVRYTGMSLCANLAGVIGAAPAPYITTWLTTHYGFASLGYYVAISALVSVIALLLMRPYCARAFLREPVRSST